MTIEYTFTHSIEADVTAEAVWSLYEDLDTWPSWDADIVHVTREGAFETGTTGTLEFRGQEPLRYRLAEVQPLQSFVDEVPVGELVVRVAHQLEPRASGSLRITYTAEIEGPADQAQAIGPMITGDFAQTMESLAALAAARSR
jgi:Polyketide cyclase / dehydrase and lipid transport